MNDRDLDDGMSRTVARLADIRRRRCEEALGHDWWRPPGQTFETFHYICQNGCGATVPERFQNDS